MLPDTFTYGRYLTKTLRSYPSFRFRDKNKLIHNASDAAKCSRAITYKALGQKESNPADVLGSYRMAFGSWLESGLKYNMMAKTSVYGVHMLSAQSDAGELGTFYGTSWHGYRDFDIGIQTPGEPMKVVVVELKTKIGYGAKATLLKNPFAVSPTYLIPAPDTEWGNSHQIALYLRDAYLKTKDNPNFSQPITDGILLQLLYADGLACFVEYFFEYNPDTDTATCYRTHCDEHPEACGPMNVVINLKDIADRWTKQDEHIREGTLAPPDFQRKYDIMGDQWQDSTKTELTKAAKNDAIMGDMQCKYCSFRDKCTGDLGISLTYNQDELSEIKKELKNR